MRRKRHSPAELLVDFRAVTVAEHPVRRQAAMLPPRNAFARSASFRPRTLQTWRRRSRPCLGGDRPARERLQRKQRGRWVATRIGHHARGADCLGGSARSVRRPTSRGTWCVSGYHRARSAASRSRKAPDRSMTRMPASTRPGPSSAAADPAAPVTPVRLRARGRSHRAA